MYRPSSGGNFCSIFKSFTEQPNFGCCKANDKSFGTAWSKSALK